MKWRADATGGFANNSCKRGVYLARGRGEESSAFDAAHVLRRGKWGSIPRQSGLLASYKKQGLPVPVSRSVPEWDVHYHTVSATQYTNI